MGIRRKDDGKVVFADTYIIVGGKIGRLAKVTDARNTEQVIRFQNILTGMGVFDKLKAMGVKDGDTIIILYVSYVGTGNKVQYFIKPEKGQLTSDHKDLDPAKIISKIEVTLKNRILTQSYHEEQ